MTVRCLGEWDVADATEVKERLLGLLDGHREMALDLSGVSFLDSAGVTCLVHAGREAGRLGINLSISKINPAIKRILEKAQIWEYVKVAPEADLDRSQE